MDSYNFYKSLYDREQNRRVVLDTSINSPITILTAIVGINLFVLDKNITLGDLQRFIRFFAWEYVFLIAVIISFVVALFFLIKSYNNLLRGFAYERIAYATEIRTYEKETLPAFIQQQPNDNQASFEDILIQRINKVTDVNTSINDQRSIDLLRAKNFTILTIIFTSLILLIRVLNI